MRCSVKRTAYFLIHSVNWNFRRMYFICKSQRLLLRHLTFACCVAVGSGSRRDGARGGRRSSLRRRHVNAAHPDHQSRSSGEGRRTFLHPHFLFFFLIRKFEHLTQQKFPTLDLTSLDVQLQSLNVKS